jgi:hypothetical protein
VTTCSHPAPVTKTYIGSTTTYQYCPDCLGTFGGEETPAKKALIRIAAIAEERYGILVEDPND